MSSPMRDRPHGGTFFFTTRLADSRSDLLLREIDRLRIATRKTMARHPFRIDAIAVLPSVIHTVWTVPPSDNDPARRWSMLKALFSRGISTSAQQGHGGSGRGTGGIWQRRFWQHPIRDLIEFEIHVALVHASPVHAGLCANPRDWRHSSIHRSLQVQAMGDGPIFARPALSSAASGLCPT